MRVDERGEFIVHPIQKAHFEAQKALEPSKNEFKRLRSIRYQRRLQQAAKLVPQKYKV